MIFREVQLAFKKNQTKPMIERFTGQSTVNVADKYLCYLFTLFWLLFSKRIASSKMIILK